MIKKVSLHFETHLRKKMEDEWEFRESPAVKAALATPSEILLILTNHLSFPATSVFPEPSKGKILTPGSHSYKGIERALNESHRVQFLFRMGPDGVIYINAEFFKRGIKKPVVTLDINALTDGTIHASHVGGVGGI